MYFYRFGFRTEEWDMSGRQQRRYSLGTKFLPTKRFYKRVWVCFTDVTTWFSYFVDNILVNRVKMSFLLSLGTCPASLLPAILIRRATKKTSLRWLNSKVLIQQSDHLTVDFIKKKTCSMEMASTSWNVFTVFVIGLWKIFRALSFYRSKQRI